VSIERLGRIMLGGVVLLALLLAACGPGSGGSTPAGDQAAQPPRVQRALVFTIRSEMPSVAAKPLRPPGLSVDMTVRLFNAGLDYIDEHDVVHPYLSEDIPKLNTDSWRVLPESRMQTSYRLKPNLTWHDGTPLSAEDFAFAFRVYNTEELGQAQSIPIVHIEDVQAPDARTLVITWKRLYPGAQSVGSTHGGTGRIYQALPRHILEQSFTQGQTEAFMAHPFWASEYIGLGPFKLDRWEPGAFIEGSAFEGHALGRATIDKVRVLFMGDPNVVLASLLSGEVHAAVDNALNYEQAAVAEREWNARGGGGRALYSPSQYRSTEVQFRPELANPPEIRDVRVRRAMVHAMDRHLQNETLIGGKGVVVDSLISPLVSYYSVVERVIRPYPYDMQRAEQLLVEAGLVKGADGFYVRPTGERFAPEIQAITGGINDNELQIMVDGFKRVGIDAQPKMLPFTVFSDRRARSLFPAFSVTGGGGSESGFLVLRSAPPSPANEFLGGGGRMNWFNAEFDRLVDEYQMTLDRQEQIQKVAGMARIFNDDLPGLPHYFNVRVTAFVANLEGPYLATNPEAGSDAWNVHLWQWRN
jgi:peptide/nickel transport system substrate-binding protein